jgi:hypothetical protein
MIQGKYAIAASKAFALMLVASSAQANLVTNGDFEQYSGLGSSRLSNSNMTGWSTVNLGSSNLFVVRPGTATTGVNYPTNNFWFWSSNSPNPGYVGVNYIPATSPTGGNFLASDAGPGYRGTIDQTVSGLTVGQQYKLSFYTGLAQQVDLNGATYANWQVSLGGQTLSTPTLNNVSHGFTGWAQDTLTFTATSPSEQLRFLAVGGPAGLPPYLFLDGVSLAPVPEPEEWAMMLVGAGLVGFQVRRKQANLKKTAV